MKTIFYTAMLLWLLYKREWVGFELLLAFWALSLPVSSSRTVRRRMAKDRQPMNRADCKAYINEMYAYFNSLSTQELSCARSACMMVTRHRIKLEDLNDLPYVGGDDAFDV